MPDERPWPHEFFDRRDPQLVEVVEVVELFEQLLAIPAKFSFRRHGEHLRRILDRFDCYSGPTAVGTRGGRGRCEPGRREGVRRIHTMLRAFALRGPEKAKVHSLAYFLPLFEAQSKKARRTWKAREGHEVWGPIEER